MKWDGSSPWIGALGWFDLWLSTPQAKSMIWSQAVLNCLSFFFSVSAVSSLQKSFYIIFSSKILLYCSFLVILLFPPHNSFSSSHSRKVCGHWWWHVATSAQRSTSMWTGAWMLLVLLCNKGKRDCRRPSATLKETCNCWEQPVLRTSMETKKEIGIYYCLLKTTSHNRSEDSSRSW